jgi:hypothetical protein
VLAQAAQNNAAVLQRVWPVGLELKRPVEVEKRVFEAVTLASTMPRQASAPASSGLARGPSTDLPALFEGTRPLERRRAVHEDIRVIRRKRQRSVKVGDGVRVIFEPGVDDAAVVQRRRIRCVQGERAVESASAWS